MIIWPEHLVLQIGHNQHKIFYMSLEEAFANDYENVSITQEEKELCYKTDSIWIIDCYPETPIGHYSVGASTFEKALHQINAINNGGTTDV